MPIPLRLVAAVAATLLLGASASAAGADGDGTLLIVGFHRAIDSALLAASGATTVRSLDALGLAVVSAPDPAAATALLHLSPAVAFVETDDPLRASGSQWDGSQWDGSQWDGSQWDASVWDASVWDGSQWDGDLATDPLLPLQWGLGAVRAPDAWSIARGSHARTICVLDTGVDGAHPDLLPNLARSPSGRVGLTAMRGGTDPGDDVGHGTQVIGIAAAVAGDGLGVAGLAQARVLSVKVMDATGGRESDLAHGLALCRAHGAHVASMSLHVTERSPALARAVAHAQAGGMLVVAAAGNAGAAAPGEPASHPGVLAVGAVAPDGTVPAWSNREPALVAPGVAIASTFRAGGYATGSGTSFAAPYAAAAAALVWEADPTLDAAGVRALLVATARDLGPAGPDAVSGAGALDAGAAVRAAAGG